MRAKSCRTQLVLYSLAGVLLLLAAAIAIPNYVPAREVFSTRACMANLKQIEGAKATWAMEWRKTPTDVPADPFLLGDMAALLRSYAA